MPLDVHFDAPLQGHVTLPGDERLTLALMASAMRPGVRLTIVNPSPAPSIRTLREFLGAYDAMFEDGDSGFSMTGSGFPAEAVFGPDAPDEVLHILLPPAMRSGGARIANPGGKRRPLIDRLTAVLEPFGCSPDLFTHENRDIIAGRLDPVSPEAPVIARSDWDIEAIAAVSHPIDGGVTISYPAATASHSLKVIELTGGRLETGADSRENKLNRRLAKVRGEIPPSVSRLNWEQSTAAETVLPGDTVLAAAVTAAALVLPKSKVTIERVLWEQGRRGFWDAARRMKGRIETKSRTGGAFDTADVTVRHSDLSGIQLTAIQALSMRLELLILGSLASAANGESVVADTTVAPGMGRARFSLLSRALELLGCRVGEYTGGIVLEGGGNLHGAHLDSGGDPLVSIALYAAALNAAGTSVIEGVESDFWPVGVFRTILRQCAGALSG